MENLVVAASNLYALRAIVFAADKGAYDLVAVITCAMMLSVAYHLVERVKHKLPGIGVIHEHEERTLLWFDRLAAANLSLYLFLVHPAPVNWLRHNWVVLAVAFAFLNYSERSEVMFSFFGIKRPERVFEFVVAHCLWHVFAFHIAYMVTVEACAVL